ncbi:MAG: flagellar FlbD family protein [Halanaerobiales bacterium]
MIKIIKMDGEEIVVNAELIETVKATPDTVIHLTTGKRILVLDEVDEIIDKVIEYKRKIMGSRGVE